MYRLFVMVGIAMLPLSAQWQQVKTRRVPLAPNGKPDLLAPAPKMAGGKTPDFSGLWNTIKIPCDLNGIGAVFGCSDVPFGVSIGLFDVTATGSEPGQMGDTPPLPYQPGVEASIRQNLAENRKGDPTTRCLPISPVRQWADFFPQKIVQTEDLVVVLSEYMAQYRQIHLDGRPLPRDSNPTFKGDPLTAEGRTTERIRRPNFGNLEVEVTVNDSKVYTKPWSAKRYLKIALDSELMEDICNENEKSSAHMVGK